MLSARARKFLVPLVGLGLLRAYAALAPRNVRPTPAPLPCACGSGDDTTAIPTDRTK
jgi:hypothetical protein